MARRDSDTKMALKSTRVVCLTVIGLVGLVTGCPNRIEIGATVTLPVVGQVGFVWRDLNGHGVQVSTNQVERGEDRNAPTVPVPSPEPTRSSDK